MEGEGAILGVFKVDDGGKRFFVFGGAFYS